ADQAEIEVHGRLGASGRGDGAGDIRPPSTGLVRVMIPLAFSRAELDMLKARIDAIAKEVAESTGIRLDYLVGTMVELPRAALRA
ncbi:putative PEP-binding protein, partial [Burkholderia sp. SIMBA_024]|uniref:putative PEP-binding protein n=1 Tax=Burkholderia sp. SIMBA_024 TaxID=3085768 RepID=UPI00397DC593